MEREQKKKMMTSAGVVALGLGAALLGGAFNLYDIEAQSAVIVAAAGWLINTIYVLFKGPSGDNG